MYEHPWEKSLIHSINIYQGLISCPSYRKVNKQNFLHGTQGLVWGWGLNKQYKQVM